MISWAKKNDTLIHYVHVELIEVKARRKKFFLRNFGEEFWGERYSILVKVKILRANKSF